MTKDKETEKKPLKRNRVAPHGIPLGPSKQVEVIALGTQYSTPPGFLRRGSRSGLPPAKYTAPAIGTIMPPSNRPVKDDSLMSPDSRAASHLDHRAAP